MSRIGIAKFASWLVRFKHSPWTYASIYLFSIFAFAFVYAEWMPQEFYHGNLKHEKQTHDNQKRLVLSLQNFFQQAEEPQFNRMDIAMNTGLLVRYEKVRFGKINILPDSSEIEIEVQIPASDTVPDMRTLGYPRRSDESRRTNTYGFLLRMAVVDLPGIVESKDLGPIDMGHCILQFRDAKYFGEYFASDMFNVAIAGRNNMLRLVRGLFIEGDVSNPITAIESSINEYPLYIPVNNQLETQIKLCVGEAKGRTFGRSNTFWRMLYFSVVTIATLGYGDITPISGPARFWSGFEVVVGLILVGLFINALFGRISNQNGGGSPPG